MSKRSKFITLAVLVLFVLACSTVTQPFNQAKGLAGTAQAIATGMPIQTLQSLATQISTQIPSGTLEALGTKMPDFEAFFDPQGTPVSEWNGIPVMPQATAGQEFKDSKTYSFKVNATVKDAQDFYKTELEKLGWKSAFSMPGNEEVAVEMFQKEGNFLTVTVTNVKGSVVVVLTMA